MISRINYQDTHNIKILKAPQKEKAKEENPNQYCETERQEPVKKWNVLYYMAGNNSISEDMLKKISRMESIGSNENINILVQLGRPNTSQYLPGGHRFYIEKHEGKKTEYPASKIPFKMLNTFSGGKSETIDSKPVEILGPVNMSDSKVLSDFIVWGMKNYPAEHTLVVIMDHGYGFLGTPDDNEARETMTINQLEEALKDAEEKTGKKIDILGLDSCLMAQIEVAEQLKQSAKFLVASEEIEYPLGWPEGSIMKRLKERISQEYVSPLECSRMIVDECSKIPESMKTASSINLGNIETVKEKASELAEKLLNFIRENPEYKEILRDIIKKTHNYCLVIPGETLCQDYRDLYDLCQNILREIKEKSVEKAAKDLIISIDNAIVAETHKGEETEGSHGISIYIPTEGFITSYKTETGAIVNPKERYMNTRFAQETLWDELIEEISYDKKG